ncbi:hypothetical protein GII33_13330 [Gordonia pseudamarae]|uniref:Uncharacterized protein n=1 Tax=Gordonia pseudamarae TaxID=2831662 RepID=A0ABX6IIK2_9ACTN|nr:MULTISPECIES: hypothetical protein [Gordonia]MBD0022659.1 hypothetical protein [Gordonia sp. (in: high G+C Gram-positive bacteria)]QHN26787.1 hypothetical protein GII33_13330 [Gordonia pseudamarae]QHN35679.1 hypothetical protein GII31_13155 [Gordonia pseudamarae]
MLALALAATLIAFVLLILGLVTGTVWLAITCILVCLGGLGFLIADVIGSARRAPSRSVEQMVGASVGGRRAASTSALTDDGSLDDEAEEVGGTPVRHRPGGPRGATRSGSIPAQPRSVVVPTAAPAWNDAAASGPRAFADVEEPAAREPGVRASGPGNASTQRLGAPTAGPSAVGGAGQGSIPAGLNGPVLGKQPDVAGYGQPAPTPPRPQSAPPSGRQPAPSPGRPAGGYDDYLRSVGGLPEAPPQRLVPPQNPQPHNLRPTSPQQQNPQDGRTDTWGGQPTTGGVPQPPRPQYPAPGARRGQFGPVDGPSTNSQETPRPWLPSAASEQPGRPDSDTAGAPPVTGRRRKIDPLDPEWRPGT